MKPDHKLLSRLSHLEGQVRDIAGMVEQTRCCIDILDQIQAIQAALRKVEYEVAKNHSANADALRAADATEARKKSDELELFSRYSK